MAGVVTQCPDCGGAFAATPGKVRCPACTRRYPERVSAVEAAVDVSGAASVPEIAAITGLASATIKAIVQESPVLRERIPLTGKCERCHKAPPEVGARFCAQCRQELSVALRDAAQGLVGKVPRSDRSSQPIRASGVVSAVNTKRERAALKRLNPVIKHGLK
ncbi:MAG: hypothetical protein HY706_06095 [Candidatus Hydrogenedentes bacterium]|nr:hypothetical protein [Candidatus Hydrogenedentota bacterium]